MKFRKVHLFIQFDTSAVKDSFGNRVVSQQGGIVQIQWVGEQTSNERASDNLVNGTVILFLLYLAEIDRSKKRERDEDEGEPMPPAGSHDTEPPVINGFLL